MSIIISPQAGMCNRFRALASAVALSLITQKKIYHYWIPSNPNSIFPHIRELQLISLESFFEKSIPRCPDDLVPDICFSEWLPGEYWYDIQSSAQKALNVKNIVRVSAENADHVVEYIFDNPEKNVLIETSNFLKLSTIDDKIWTKMVHNIYSTFIPNKRYSDILIDVPIIETGISIRCIDFFQYFPEAYQSFENILEWLDNFDEFALFSDSDDVKDQLKNALLNNSNNKKIYDGTIIKNKNPDLVSWEYGFVQFLFLATKCKHIYGTPKSSFAFEAAIYGNRTYNETLDSLNFSSGSNITITKATYGTYDKYFDVTKILNDISQKKEYLIVSNELFGDPNPFNKKYLKVVYIDNTSRIVMENERFYFNLKSK